MCKVFMMPGITDENRPKAEKLVKEMAKIISFIDEDGVGYAAITAEGKIFGEKWVNKDDAFQIHASPAVDNALIKMQSTFDGAAKFRVEPKVQGVVYGSYGNLKNADKAVAVLLHARKKTVGDKTVENTHPFFQFADPNDSGDVDTALIHNGSIANHAELTKVHSTCDSEVILHEYLKNSMNWNPWAIETLSQTLIGEYAVGVLTSCLYNDGSVLPILDVFKSGKDLYVGWIEELKTFAFCTSQANLENGCRTCGLTLKHVMEVDSGNYMRFDAITGERCEDVIKFKMSDRGYAYRNRQAGSSCTYPYGQQHGPPATNVRELNPGKPQTVEDVKRQFARNHQSLFNQEYVIPADLSKEEKEFFEQAEKDHKTNHKALRFVASVIGKTAQG
jgi:hypothetical protein